MLKSTGVPEREQLDAVTPPASRRSKGPVAMFECFERIPCDPCYHACKHGAVKEFLDICDVPEVDFERCTGCGLCVVACPGLAIFILDETPSDHAVVGLPYEMLPVPEPGQEVTLLDREGRELGKGEVSQVSRPRVGSGTLLVKLKIPKEMVQDVRSFRLERGTP